VYETKNVLRTYAPEEAAKRIVFIIIAIVIIIIKFDVERHFLIMARTEDNITVTAFPRRRKSGSYPRGPILFIYIAGYVAENVKLCFNKHEHYPKLFIRSQHLYSIYIVVYNIYR